MRKRTKTENSVQYLEVIGWDVFVSTMNEICTGSNGYIFRGHSSDKWLLESTLDRKLKEISPEFSNDTSYEYIKESLLKKFKYSTRGLIESNSPKNTLEWWELGQHFGLWTPLLDWSRSPFVAAYFAISGEKKENEDYCVWALSTKTIEEKGSNGGGVEVELYDPISSSNPRLLRQQGLFTFNRHLNDMESWVSANFPGDEKISLYKIILKDIDPAKALVLLDKMNISDSTLFPDLMGSASYSNKCLQRELLDKIKKNAHKSGKGWSFSNPPHSTRHAGPHRAFQR